MGFHGTQLETVATACDNKKTQPVVESWDERHHRLNQLSPFFTYLSTYPQGHFDFVSVMFPLLRQNRGASTDTPVGHPGAVPNWAHMGQRGSERLPHRVGRAGAPGRRWAGRRWARRSISRVLSPPAAGRGMTIHLGRPLPDASRDQPGRRPGTAVGRKDPPAPIRSCSRWGLPCRTRCRLRGALLPHPFTLARPEPGGLLSVALSRGSPPPGVTRHRVPVEPGLSSPGGAGGGHPTIWPDTIHKGNRATTETGRSVQLVLPGRSARRGRRTTRMATPVMVSAPPTARLQENGSPSSAIPATTPNKGTSRVNDIMWLTP